MGSGGEGSQAAIDISIEKLLWAIIGYVQLLYIQSTTQYCSATFFQLCIASIGFISPVEWVWGLRYPLEGFSKFSYLITSLRPLLVLYSLQ